jgi:hypothetical protein
MMEEEQSDNLEQEGGALAMEEQTPSTVAEAMDSIPNDGEKAPSNLLAVNSDFSPAQVSSSSLVINPNSSVTIGSPPKITTLPTELLFKIFSLLHLPSAVCLGLTNKILWAVLKTLYPGKISMAFGCFWCCRYDKEDGILFDRISEWMKPRVLFPSFYGVSYKYGDYKYVTHERYIELYAQYWEDYDRGVNRFVPGEKPPPLIKKEKTRGKGGLLRKALSRFVRKG